MKKGRSKPSYGRVRADSGHQKRIRWTALLLGILAFFPVGFRLHSLMVTDYDYYAGLARRNQSRTTQITARRGNIYDRNMNILACSQSVSTVYLAPVELHQADEDLDTIARELGMILELDPAMIREKGEDRSLRYQMLASRVDQQTADRIRSFISDGDITGVHIEPATQRYYPYGSLASQVIGFTNASNTGSEGVEAAYNGFLEGSAGKVIATRGNHEMIMPGANEEYISGREGCSLILTLDATVQACLEKQMEAAVARYDVQNGAFGMVMDVDTGEILAMATLGNYDPNAYLEIADPEVSRQLEQMKLKSLLDPLNKEATQEYSKAKQEAQLKQWRNRCISDGYEPGSTFKVLTMAAALDSGAITLETGFHCGGSEQIPGRAQRLHCWRSTGHGSQQTPQALQNSCNIALAHIALKMGGEVFYDYVQRFGVLEKTGIDLNGESKGVFFDKSLVTDTDKWGTASLTSGSFGQTFKLTPLQLVRAIAAVVNGGSLMEPYLVAEVMDPEGNTLLRQEPTVLRQVISKETSETMCTLMQSVVEEGTAKNAAVSGYSIGGKTGTSEKIDVFDASGQRVQDKIVSFVGVAPMEDPRYIVLVALDTPSRQTGIYISGGVMAAPTVGAVLADILPYLGVIRSEEAAQPVTLADMTGMTAPEAENYLKAQGLTFDAIGTEERVTAQLPSPGETVFSGGQVLLYFGDSPEVRAVTVPDFTGMNRQQANDAAGKLGLYILVQGNTALEPQVVVTEQSEPKDSQVAVGTTIILTFTDLQAAD